MSIKQMMRGSALSVLLLSGAVAACGDGGSAVETRDRTGNLTPQALLATTTDLETAPDTAAEISAAETSESRPAMTANRRETTDAKIERLYRRNGSAFGSRSAAHYLQQVEAFTRHPPEGTERVERANGDVLLYQASTNTFAVISRQGVPKTMFKPDDGPAYWEKQKEAAPTFGRRRSGT